ncbi:MAG: peptide ABC transporter substrate-binding protein [Clostridium sp.]|uniref:peptide ABC transporter substrate-binding protein n=1 Tax=Clostridium sp. TaxID=1506 RepID=UPI003D6C82DD
MLNKKKLSRKITLALCIALTMTMFAGCTSKTPVKEETKTKEETKVVEEQSVVYNLGAQPDTIDPTLLTTVGGMTIANQVFEGLMRLDENNKPVVAAAEKVDFDEKAPTKYVFHLRKDAKWSDGKAVTAKDFEYSWKRVLNPKTASDYANQLYYLKNGQAYNGGKAKVEDVGVKATDDYTLEVELAVPTAYFLQLCALSTLMPVRQDIVEKDPEKWTLNPETYVGNGPFKLTSWTHDASMEYVKNDNYWNKAEVKLDKMKFVMIVQSTSALAAFETGEVDYLDDLPSNDIPKLVADKKAVSVPYIGNYYISLNNKIKGLDNSKVRKALALAIDRPLLIEAVWKDPRKPATAWVPFGISDSDTTKQFRTVGGDYYDGKGDIAEAKKLLAQAGYPDGKGFPEFQYAYNKNETHAKIAQAVQDMWKKNLGVNIKLTEVDWKVFVPQRRVGDYQISRDGWIGDFMDPMTFMDIMVSTDGNNHPKYNNPKYDELVLGAKKEADPVKRMQMLHDAEKILMEDMPVVPVAFYVSNVACKTYVKGVRKIPTGMMYFDRAFVEGKAAK